MTEPLALLPLAAAARGGRLGGHEAAQLVAAGFELLRRCPPLVRALSGRRAAILLPTSPAFLTALAASDGRGAVLLNPLASPSEILHQLTDARVGAAFTHAALAAKLPPILPRVLLDDSPRTARWLGDGRTRDVDLGSHFGFPLEGADDAPGRDEEAAIVYTSAMAGTPLGAILTHRGLLANARATVVSTELSREDRTLAVLPLSHLFGLTVTCVAPLLAGGDVLPTDRFNPLRAAEQLGAGEVTALIGVPAVFAAVLAGLGRRGAGSGALRLSICGGAPLAPELQSRWADTTGVELRQGYGLTEAGPVCLFNRVQLPNRHGTLGMPLPGVEISIRDPGSSAALPVGAVGEICVAGENVFAGYVSGGEHGLQTRGRWLHTGDQGAADADGTVTFRGVLKAMFTRNGFNIYPREIERAVEMMPGVVRARASALPNLARENDVRLDVDGAVTMEDVRAWCAERLSAYKQPADVRVL
ncbi:MAG: AMP-binding protein [Gemmatimonadaceae bacterium]